MVIDYYLITQKDSIHVASDIMFTLFVYEFEPAFILAFCSTAVSVASDRLRLYVVRVVLKLIQKKRGGQQFWGGMEDGSS